MGLEVVTDLSDLIVTNPEDGDDPTDGAAHLRYLKVGLVTTTMGTVEADKPVTVDSNKDTTGLRNVTATGTVTAALLDGAAIKDEDDMSSDSATHLATQQSIKAYIDNIPGLTLQIQRGEDAAYAATSSSVGTDDTIPQISEGLEIVTVAITPKASGNKIIVKANVVVSANTSATTAIASLFIDATANALETQAQTIYADDTFGSITLEHEYTSVGTSEVTFRLRVGTGDGVGSVYINGHDGARHFGGVANTFISATEVQQ